MGEYGRMNKVRIRISYFPYLLLKKFISLTIFWIVQILKELHKSCQKPDGSDDQKKGTQLLEVYAIEIQMYTETKNNKKLKVRNVC